MGTSVGRIVGEGEGSSVGVGVGIEVGCSVGVGEGTRVGCSEGWSVGRTYVNTRLCNTDTNTYEQEHVMLEFAQYPGRQLRAISLLTTTDKSSAGAVLKAVIGHSHRLSTCCKVLWALQ